ncbi:hypothetical protein [Dyadobacter bucti]|uniref:hypothetical protein n=1 Tax=Dyadobacter bucti TaxID=2572203 RepID=UPI0011088158|nr:hypothetical protein [Dyadobacter bucti]
MKKNLYFRAVLRRSNPVKELFFNLFTAIASWPRLLLEVFIRKNFGERYFSFSNAVIMALFLAGLLPLFGLLTSVFTSYFNMKYFLMNHLTWYLFLIVLVFVAYLKKREIKRLPSVFDFARFSLSTGEINPLFYTIKIKGNYVETREIETICEPLFCMIIGLLIILAGQVVGILIVFCSIVYSLSYMAAYHVGDNFVMDKIDELLCNQELYNAFVDGVDPSKTRGVNYYGRRPADPEARRRVADAFIDQDEEETVDAQ